MAHTTIQQFTMATSQDEHHEMMAVWPDIVRDITDAGRELDLPNLVKWIIKVLQYNVPEGKKTRSLALISAYKSLMPNDQLTKDNIRLVRILAWCVEIMQAFLLVMDDIQDRSLYRRNQPCWYLHEDVGLAAVNDGTLLENLMYYLLKKHFKERECYVDLIETFHDIVLKTIMGQTLDLLATNFGKKPNVDLFTMDRYDSIAMYKTAYYTTYLPVILAMHFAGIKDPEKFRQSKTILLEMGHFFQVQDDYLGCYNNREAIGKDTTDISEGKCTWLVVMAMQRVTSQQRKILEECYGSTDPENVKRVIQVYNDLGLPDTYATYEEKTYNLLSTRVREISCGLPHSLFQNLLEKLYHRSF